MFFKLKLCSIYVTDSNHSPQIHLHYWKTRRTMRINISIWRAFVTRKAYSYFHGDFWARRKGKHHGGDVIIMTSSNGNIFRVTGPFNGELTGDRSIPLTEASVRSFDVLIDLRLNKRLSKQSRRRWFETPSPPLWRHCNDKILFFSES